VGEAGVGILLGREPRPNQRNNEWARATAASLSVSKQIGS